MNILIKDRITKQTNKQTNDPHNEKKNTIPTSSFPASTYSMAHVNLYHKLNIKKQNKMERLATGAQRWRTKCVSEKLGLVPSTYVRQLPAICDSISRGPIILSWTLWCNCTHTNTLHTHEHTIKNALKILAIKFPY